jgi:hypothetical protein
MQNYFQQLKMQLVCENPQMTTQALTLCADTYLSVIAFICLSSSSSHFFFLSFFHV